MKLQTTSVNPSSNTDLNSLLETNQIPRELLSLYHFQQHGSSVFVYLKENDSLVAHFNSFDNTLLILQPNGFQIADAFGSKRFPLGQAREELNQQNAAEINAIAFKRDLKFPLISPTQKPEINYRTADFSELLHSHPETSKLYNDLADLFSRCSDYTPSKKEEFVAGGALADKFCRFNRENQKTLSGVCTINTFLLDEKNDNKMVATQSATIILHPNEEVDIYLYDEVADYFTLLTPDQIQEYQKHCANRSELSDEDKNTPIAIVVESKREELFTQLFTATREKIKEKLHELLPSLNAQEIELRINSNKIRAIIRAATVWYPYSAKLNCVPEKNGIFVIHGPRTDLGNSIDQQIKDWATIKIKTILETHSYPISLELKKKKRASVYDEVTATLSTANSDEDVTGNTSSFSSGLA